MNIRNHLIEIQCNYRDVGDVAQAIVHSIIFFRTHGKFNYKHEGSYSIGTLGFERVYCDHLDFNYIRCSSQSLANKINNKIQEFVDKINEYSHSGTLALEFYTKKPSRWPFNESKFVWELWNIRTVISPGSVPALSAGEHLANYQQQHHNRLLDINSSNRTEDLLSHKILDIVRIVNSDKCSLPQMPTQPNLDTVFDTSFSDLQPYLFNLSHKISETAPGSHSVIGGTTTKYSDGATVTDNTTQSTFRKFLLGTLEL